MTRPASAAFVILLLYALCAGGAAWAASYLRRPLSLARLLLLAALPLLYLAPFWLAGKTMLPADHGFLTRPAPGTAPTTVWSDDAGRQFAPWAEAVRLAWAKGEWPHRFRWSGSGMTLDGNGASAAYSPLTLLGLVLPLPAFFTFRAAARLFLALSGMWLWLRELRLSSAAALFGAVAFAFSLAMTAWLLFPHTGVIPLWPWILFTLERLRDPSGRRRAFAVLILLFALLPLSGHLESAASGCLFAAIWLAARRVAGDRAETAPVARAVAAAAPLALALSAFSLLPQALVILASNRFALTEHPFWHDVLSWIPHAPGSPWTAVLPFFPRALGDGIASPLLPGSIGSFPEMAQGYFGIVGAALALLVLRPGSRRPPAEKALLVPLVFGLGVASGAWPFAEIAALLPGLNRMLPARFLAWLPLAGAAVAAFELDRLNEDLTRRRGAAALALSLFAGPALLGLWLERHLRPLHAAAGGLLYQRKAYLLAGAALLASAAVVAAAARRPRLFGSAGAALLTLVAAAELFRQGTRLVPPSDPENLYPKTPLVRFLESRPGVFRIVGETTAFYPNVGVFAGLEDVRTHDPAERRDYVEFLDATCGYDPVPYFKRIRDVSSSALDFLNVRYLVGEAGRAAPSEKWTAVYSGDDGTVFENARVLPRVFAPDRVELASESRAAPGPDADWSREATVAFEGPPPRVAPGASVAEYAENGNAVTFRSTSPGETILVASLVNDGGWRGSDETRGAGSDRPRQRALSRGRGAGRRPPRPARVRDPRLPHGLADHGRLRGGNVARGGARAPARPKAHFVSALPATVLLLLLYGTGSGAAILFARWIGRPVPSRVALLFLLLPVAFLAPGVLHDRAPLGPDQAYLTAPAPVPPGPRGSAWLDDVVHQILPWHVAVREAFRNGELPLRNPWNGCGTVLDANGQSAAFSPWTALAFPLPPLSALSLWGALRLFLGLGGMWLWLTELSLSGRAAVFGAIAFGFSMTMTAWIFFPLTAAVGLWPWALFLMERLGGGQTRRRAAAGLAAVFFLWPLSGHSETAASAAAFTALWLLARALLGDRGRVRRLLAPAAAAALLAVGLSAFSLLPQTLAIGASNRLALVAKPFWTPILSLAPHAAGWSNGALALLFPRLFGDNITVPTIPGAAGAFPEVAAGYVGILPAALLVLLFRPGSARPAWQKALAVPAAFGVGAAIGLWPFAEAVSSLPVLSHMFPLRYLTWFALAASAIAAGELDRLVEDADRRPSARIWPIAALLAVLLLAFGTWRRARGVYLEAGFLDPARRGFPARGAGARGGARDLRGHVRPRAAPPILGNPAPDGRRGRGALRPGDAALSLGRPREALPRDPARRIPAPGAAPVPSRRRRRDALPERQRPRRRRGGADPRRHRAARLRGAPRRGGRLRAVRLFQAVGRPRRAGARLPERPLPRRLPGARRAVGEVASGLRGRRRNRLPERPRAPPRVRPRTGPAAKAASRSRVLEELRLERRGRSGRRPRGLGRRARDAKRIGRDPRLLRARQFALLSSSRARRARSRSRREPRGRRRMAGARRVREPAADGAGQRSVSRDRRPVGGPSDPPRLRAARVPGRPRRIGPVGGRRRGGARADPPEGPLAQAAGLRGKRARHRDARRPPRSESDSRAGRGRRRPKATR